MPLTNLLTDEWLPSSDGRVSVVGAMRAQSLSVDRPDWEVASICFLAALLQTAIVRDPELCADELDWEEHVQSPPDGLESWLEPFIDVMEFGRFLQTPINTEDITPVSRLLPEQPGDNTLKKNGDLVVWRGDTPSTLPVLDGPLALYSETLWAHLGGSGHYGTIRTGGSALTLLEPDTPAPSLWQRLWLNVLPHDRWVVHYGDAPWDEAKVFPWISGMRGDVTPEDAHPAHVLWSMPRRQRLLIEDDVVVGLAREAKGIRYQGWRHPFTPQVQLKEGGRMGWRLPSPHVAYNHWAGLLFRGGFRTEPAVVVSEHVQRRQTVGRPRLRVCGWQYQADGVHAWVDNLMPLVMSDHPDELAAGVEKMVAAAAKVNSSVNKAIKAAGGSPSSELFEATESAFFDRVQNAPAADVRADWLAVLRKQARAVFDEKTSTLRRDPLAVAKARAKLARDTYGKTLTAVLDISTA